jgi:hypothetical protein
MMPPMTYKNITIWILISYPIAIAITWFFNGKIDLFPLPFFFAWIAYLIGFSARKLTVKRD